MFAAAEVHKLQQENCINDLLSRIGECLSERIRHATRQFFLYSWQFCNKNFFLQSQWLKIISIHCTHIVKNYFRNLHSHTKYHSKITPALTPAFCYRNIQHKYSTIIRYRNLRHTVHDHKTQLNSVCCITLYSRFIKTATTEYIRYHISFTV